MILQIEKITFTKGRLHVHGVEKPFTFWGNPLSIRWLVYLEVQTRDLIEINLIFLYFMKKFPLCFLRFSLSQIKIKLSSQIFEN